MRPCRPEISGNSEGSRSPSVYSAKNIPPEAFVPVILCSASHGFLNPQKNEINLLISVHLYIARVSIFAMLSSLLLQPSWAFYYFKQALVIRFPSQTTFIYLKYHDWILKISFLWLQKNKNATFYTTSIDFAAFLTHPNSKQLPKDPGRLSSTLALIWLSIPQLLWKSTMIRPQQKCFSAYVASPWKSHEYLYENKYIY